MSSETTPLKALYEVWLADGPQDRVVLLSLLADGLWLPIFFSIGSLTIPALQKLFDKRQFGLELFVSSLGTILRPSQKHCFPHCAPMPWPFGAPRTLALAMQRTAIRTAGAAGGRIDAAEERGTAQAAAAAAAPAALCGGLHQRRRRRLLALLGASFPAGRGTTCCESLSNTALLRASQYKRARARPLSLALSFSPSGPHLRPVGTAPKGSVPKARVLQCARVSCSGPICRAEAPTGGVACGSLTTEAHDSKPARHASLEILVSSDSTVIPDGSHAGG